jgi:rRNA processing protein Krr1/Pno1
MEWENTQINVEKCFIDSANRDMWIHIFRNPFDPYVVTNTTLIVKTMNLAFRNPSTTTGSAY